MHTALIIIHVIICVILMVVVLMQHGKQQGLSGAIAGGAETFFGKNKGRTIDAVLRKVTAVVAILFVISSIGLVLSSNNQKKKADEAAAAEIAKLQEEMAQAETAPAYTINDEGALVDAAGSVIATAEGLADEANFNEAGDLINPATSEVLVAKADIDAAKAAKEAADAAANEAAEGAEGTETAENAENTENAQ